jgi:hypothetical protein
MVPDQRRIVPPAAHYRSQRIHLGLILVQEQNQNGDESGEEVYGSNYALPAERRAAVVGRLALAAHQWPSGSLLRLSATPAGFFRQHRDKGPLQRPVRQQGGTGPGTPRLLATRQDRPVSERLQSERRGRARIPARDRDVPERLSAASPCRWATMLRMALYFICYVQLHTQQLIRLCMSQHLPRNQTVTKATVDVC